MAIKFAVLIIFLTASPAICHMVGKIVNGKKADMKLWPFMAYLVFYQESGGVKRAASTCGGSILSSQVVLTAAHCLDDVTYYKKKWSMFQPYVFMGAANLDKSTVMRRMHDYHTHEKYDVRDTLFDIGLVFLASPINFTLTVKKVVLMTRPMTVESDSNLLIAGWGVVMDPVTNKLKPTRQLQYLEQKYIPQEECGKYLTELDKGTICAGKVNDTRYVFKGDSGGPLVKKEGIQVGIVSYMVNSVTGVTVYTNVFLFMDWIAKTFQDLHKTHCVKMKGARCGLQTL